MDGGKVMILQRDRCIHQSCFQFWKTKCLNRLKTRSDVFQKACFQWKRRKNHIHQRAFQVFVGDVFAQYHWGQNYYIPFFLFWGIIFGNSYRKLYSVMLLGKLIPVMYDWCCSSLEGTNISVTVTVFLSVLCGHKLLKCNPVSLQVFYLFRMPSDTKLLLTKTYFEIIIFGKITNLARNSLKMSFFPGHFERTKCLKNYEK